MGETTEISWCDHTFNPWIGCTRVSAACDFCYAERWAKRTGQAHLWRGERRRTSETTWRSPVKWNEWAARDGVRRRVFCASLADWLDNQVDPQWREDLAVLIDATPHLDWLLLTKRPQNWGKLAPWHDDDIPRNVWLGVTVENQEEAERRIPLLLAMGARISFLSCEPLLQPVDFDHVLHQRAEWLAARRQSDRPNRIDWVICGGESGPRARPMNLEWARSLRDQCRAANIPFHFKQWGGNRPKDGGCLLDDREYKEFPV